VRSASGLGFDIVFGGMLEDPCRRFDGRLGRLEDGGPSGRPPGGEDCVEAAPSGVCAGCLQKLSALERGAENLLLCLTDLLAWRRVGLLPFTIADGFGGAKRLDFLVGVAAA
jgi:hypothetical protein